MAGATVKPQVPDIFGTQFWGASSEQCGRFSGRVFLALRMQIFLKEAWNIRPGGWDKMGILLPECPDLRGEMFFYYHSSGRVAKFTEGRHVLVLPTQNHRIRVFGSYAKNISGCFGVTSQAFYILAWNGNPTPTTNISCGPWDWTFDLPSASPWLLNKHPGVTPPENDHGNLNMIVFGKVRNLPF